MIRSLRIAALALGLILGVPGVAGAATATITNDAGTDTPLTAPTTIRYMSPQFKLAFGATEKRYSVSIVGPAGTAAADASTCRSVTLYDPTRVRYQGNGLYTALVTTTTDAADVTCAAGQPTTFSFAIDASATVTSPAAQLRTRRPNATDVALHAFPLGVNPGSEFTEVRYALDGVVGADGSLPGTPAGGLVPVDMTTAPLRFGTPGRYAVIARPTTVDGAGPWSAPIFVNVRAPFDLAAPPRFSDLHGPVLRVRGQVRAPEAAGRKLVVRVAPGAKGGRFHLVRTIKIGKDGKFALKFTVRGAGVHRVRLHFRGTARVTPGTVIKAFRPR